MLIALSSFVLFPLSFLAALQILKFINFVLDILDRHE